MRISVDKILFHWTNKIVKRFKVWEVQLSLNWDPSFRLSVLIDWLNLHIVIFNLFEFDLYTYRKEDHAGTFLEFKILGLEIYINHHDVRHWDYENECWEESGKSEDWNRIDWNGVNLESEE